MNAAELQPGRRGPIQPPCPISKAIAPSAHPHRARPHRVESESVLLYAGAPLLSPEPLLWQFYLGKLQLSLPFLQAQLSAWHLHYSLSVQSSSQIHLLPREIQQFLQAASHEGLHHPSHWFPVTFPGSCWWVLGDGETPPLCLLLGSLLCIPRGCPQPQTVHSSSHCHFQCSASALHTAQAGPTPAPPWAGGDASSSPARQEKTSKAGTP